MTQGDNGETKGRETEKAAAICEMTADGEDSPQVKGRWRDSKAKCGFVGYLTICFSISATSAAGSIISLSSMGFGEDALKFLEKQENWWYASVSVMVSIFFLLYILDFFSPPQFPGRHFMLFQGDRLVGPALLVIGIGAFVAALLLSARTYPGTPIMVSVFACPVAFVIARWAVKPQSHGRYGQLLEEAGNLSTRLAFLRDVTGEEKDQQNFYGAACASLLVTALACLAVWVPWTVEKGELSDLKKNSQQSRRDQDAAYIMWATPLIVAASFFIFSLMAGMRLLMDPRYNDSAGQTKQWALATSKNMVKEIQQARQTSGAETADVPIRQESTMSMRISRCSSLASQRDHHAERLQQLVNIVKFCVLSMIVMLGAMYATFQLVFSDSHIATMVQGFVGTLFIFFIAFVNISFKRVWNAMSSSLKELPLWRKFMEWAQADWMRAIMFCVALPAAPFVLALSAITQCMRRCRGIAGKSHVVKMASSRSADGEDLSITAIAEEDKSLNTESSIFTERVQRYLRMISVWDRLAILQWVYALSILTITLTVAPRLLNVFLAVMRKVLEETSFFLVCVCMFAIGLTLFLIPVVPGAPIFFFGGVLLPPSCEFGFWSGATISIFLGWILKLAACAMQQKLIGGMLGSSLWVRQNVGVHKPFIRTIEMVLRKPGLSLGKVSILCGGPDWPTSVLAGVLGLSLPQMILGTTPILFFVAPFSLSGTFYLNRDPKKPDGIWSRSSNLMFTVTGMVCVILWAIMAWAWQDVYDKNHDEVTKVKEEYIDLDWSDHCSKMIKERCQVSWGEVPRLVLALYAAGAVAEILVAHSFWWGTSNCFGEFGIKDDTTDIEWYGNKKDSIFKFPGLIGLIVAVVGCGAFMVFRCWQNAKVRGPVRVCVAELKQLEPSWKEQRRLIVRDVHAKSTEKDKDDTLLTMPPQIRSDDQQFQPSVDTTPLSVYDGQAAQHVQDIPLSVDSVSTPPLTVPPLIVDTQRSIPGAQGVDRPHLPSEIASPKSLESTEEVSATGEATDRLPSRTSREAQS